MIHVVIVDDQKMVRNGFHALLLREKDMDVVGEACDGQEAVELVQRLDPDVVTMDIQMPRLDGLEATRRICRANSQVKVVIVTMSRNEALIGQALQIGAKGYVGKTNMFELVPAISAVHAGRSYFSSEILDFLSRQNNIAS